MTTAVFPGSFDPPTYGHLDIINRASKIFDKIDIVIAVNPEKKYLFSDQERFSLFQELTKDYKNISIHKCNGLIVDYCKKTGANVLIRGVRNFNDFSYEFDLSLVNRSLNQQVETIFIPTDQKSLLLRSSSIKELAMFGGDISKMVPPPVEKALKEKFKK